MADKLLPAMTLTLTFYDSINLELSNIELFYP